MFAARPLLKDVHTLFRNMYYVTSWPQTYLILQAPTSLICTFEIQDFKNVLPVIAVPCFKGNNHLLNSLNDQKPE